MLSNDAIQEAAQRLAAAAQAPLKVILFGSYSRGDADEGSRLEFEKRREWCSTPVYWAVLEGKVLYESGA